MSSLSRCDSFSASRALRSVDDLFLRYGAVRYTVLEVLYFFYNTQNAEIIDAVQLTVLDALDRLSTWSFYGKSAVVKLDVLKTR